MSNSKLKSNKARLLAYMGFAYLISYIAESQLFGTYYSAWIWGSIFIIWGIAQWLRTKIVFFAIFGTLCGLGAWHYELAAHANTVLSMPTFLIHLIVILAVVVLRGIKIFNRQKQLEQNARRIFELAAGQIDEAADGFTGRPFVSGTVNYKPEEIQAFARFLNSAQVVSAQIEKDKTVMLFSLTTSPLVRPPLDNVSYVAFDFSGNITVHIAKSDYRQYKKQLTFDQLCQRLGKVFQTMLDFYQKGDRQKALDWLKC